MVGLPARGKTYMAQKLARYLGWQGYRARVFNVGSYRRQRLGAGQDAAFFDPENPTGVAARRDMALAALEDVFQWLEAGGHIAIYDATNSTRSRRVRVRKAIEDRGISVLFVESVCDDPALIEANIRQTKLSSPDYEGVPDAQAVRDFRARIAMYERAYEPLEEDELSWVKIVDVGRQMVANNVQGYLPSRLAFYLMNLHIAPRPIYLTRHGQSQYNTTGRLGGDPGLSKRGAAYAAALGDHLPQQLGERPKVWCSTLQRAVQTASTLPWPVLSLRELDEIDAGICDGWTYAEVQERLPEEFAARKADKLRYRYPRGESYQDVIRRLNGVIIEIERSRRPVVVVAHQAVLRALYAYLVGHSQTDCPHLEMPLHTLIELVPRAYGCDETRHRYDHDTGEWEVGPRITLPI